MDVVYKNIANFVVRPFLKWYLKRVTPFKYQDLYFEIFPGVFHPSFFFSTKFLLSYLERFNLEGMRFCEPGCGSGVISIFAAKKGALVTAFDINPTAVENVKHNIELNTIPLKGYERITILRSDLFDSLPPDHFDMIVINPPYFFKDPLSDEQKAWFCGTDGAYFKKLFYQVTEYMIPETQVYMILAQNCERAKIMELALSFGLGFELMVHKKIWWETNYIYRISHKKPLI
jgi:release factor glutamine methyltransferase